MEGQSGIAVRAEAWHRDMQLGDEGVPFYAVTTPIGMAMEDAPDVLQLRQAIEDTLGGVSPDLIVVDTLARSFAGSGADENSATDMGMFIRSCDLLKEWFDCTVLAVHHSGKDSDKGLRGSSSLLGAVDTSIAIKRTTGTEYIEVIVQKQKDVSEADPLAMAAREVAFVQDAFAQEQSSLVLDVTDGIPKNKKLSDGQQQCIDVLAELLRAGTFTETDEDGSKGVRSDVLRRAVAADGKNYSDSGWSDFTSRLVSKELLSKNNGLFNIGMKA
jgi:RecA-family ATPase